MCKAREESLVQIESQQEQDFVWHAITKTAGYYTWAGGKNDFGTKTFRWLDGNEVNYTNWYNSRPKEDVFQVNGIQLGVSLDGTWYDQNALSTSFVLCELKKSSQLVPKDKQLEEKLKEIVTIGTEQTNRLRNELLKLISDEKETVKNANINLGEQVKDLAFEVEFQKRKNNQLTSKLNADVEKSKKQIEHLESELSKSTEQNKVLIHQNELLELRLNRIEHKLASKVIDNPNTLLV